MLHVFSNCNALPSVNQMSQFYHGQGTEKLNLPFGPGKLAPACPASPLNPGPAGPAGPGGPSGPGNPIPGSPLTPA